VFSPDGNNPSSSPQSEDDERTSFGPQKRDADQAATIT
jgi:hypothetical protein